MHACKGSLPGFDKHVVFFSLANPPANDDAHEQIHPAKRHLELEQDNGQDTGQHRVHENHNAGHEHHLLAGGFLRTQEHRAHRTLMHMGRWP